MNKDIEEFNNIINQQDLTDIDRTHYWTTVEDGSVHGTYTKIDNTLDYKTNLNTIKRTEIIRSVFCDHNRTELEISNRKKTKHPHLPISSIVTP